MIGGSVLLVDGTIKFYRQGGFPRPWPNVVCSSDATITDIDLKWSQTGLGSLIKSPSLHYKNLLHPGNEELT
jgi:hypothetical protein